MNTELKLTFPSFFENSLKKYGQADFLSFVDDTPLTYNDVNNEINKLKAMG